MDAIFQHVVFWHWWVVATALLLLETVTGTFYLLWVSFAAAVVGVVLFLVPAMTWEWQLLLFSVLSVSSALLWHRWRVKQPEQATDQPKLNRRGEQYVGRQFTLEADIVNGQGKLRVDDTSWRVSGPDLPAGRTVRVVRADGATLVVESVS
ncbi:MAG: NfeD family protein [Candidatus Acidiferrales bacterium]